MGELLSAERNLELLAGKRVELTYDAGTLGVFQVAIVPRVGGPGFDAVFAASSRRREAPSATVPAATSTSTSTPTSTSTSTSTPTSTSTSTSTPTPAPDGTLRSSTPRAESGETDRGHTLASHPSGAVDAPAPRRRLLAALVALALAAGAWAFTRAPTTPAKTPPSSQCTYTMLDDAPIDVGAKLTWVAGAGSTHGVAIAAVSFVDGGIREARVLAGRDGVTIRRPSQTDDPSPVGLDVRWIEGTPRAVVSVHPSQDMQAELVTLRPFATDMLSDFQRVGGQMFCRPKACTYAVADVAVAFARLEPAPAAAKLVAVATTQEKDGSRAVRLFGAGYGGDVYFAGQPGHTLDAAATAHDDGVAAVAFIYDGKVHLGRLGEDAPAVTFGEGVKKLALGASGGVVHAVFVDRAGLHLLRQGPGAPPVETVARTELTEPTALSLVVTGDRISLSVREGGRAGFAAGTTAEALARTSAHVVDSQPRDGPWSAPGSAGTVLTWIEDSPVRVRRAVAMCP
jgi:hypothetical protein